MTVILCLIVTALMAVTIGCKEPSPDIMPPLDDGVKGMVLEVSCEEFTATPQITRNIEITYPGSLVVSLCANPSTGYQWGNESHKYSACQ